MNTATGDVRILKWMVIVVIALLLASFSVVAAALFQIALRLPPGYGRGSSSSAKCSKRSADLLPCVSMPVSHGDLVDVAGMPVRLADVSVPDRFIG